jgi:hypothetical protein
MEAAMLPATEVTMPAVAAPKLRDDQSPRYQLGL